MPYHKIPKIILLLLLSASLHAVTTEVPTKYYETLKAYCTEYEVNIVYASRLISYESGWKERHINKNPNKTVDKGIMQLNSACMYDLARWHNEGKSFDPMDWKVAMRIGIKHMRFLYDKTGSWWGAVASYNMGLTGWEEWVAGKRPLPIGTKKEMDYIFK